MITRCTVGCTGVLAKDFELSVLEIKTFVLEVYEQVLSEFSKTPI